MSTFTYEFNVEFSCDGCVRSTKALLDPLTADFIISYETSLLGKKVKIVCNREQDPQVLVNLLSTIKPATFISSLENTEIPEGVRVNIPSSQKEYDYHIYFENDIDFERALNSFCNRTWCAGVRTDVHGHRFRIILKPNEDISPNEIQERLDFVNYRFKDRVKRIQNNDTLYHFSIKGLRSHNDIEKIEQVLSRKAAYIKYFEVNYSTSVVSIVVNVEAAKINTFIDILKHSLQNSFDSRIIDLEPISLSSIKSSRPKTLPKQYFRSALFNVLFVLGLVLLGGFIPLPLTVSGQLVGLALGGMTLSMMWKTGGEFYREAWNKFKNERKFNMYALITLGTGSAWVYSMILVLVPGLFPVAALQYQFLAVNMILGIINFGRGIRVSAENRTELMIQSLKETYTANQPRYAKVVRQDAKTISEALYSYEQIKYKLVKEGDLILVEAEEKFPVEGVILEGETNVEQSALTGESSLIDKKVGDSVYSGSYNNKSTVLIKASCDGAKGHLTRCMEEVAKGKSSSPSILRLADKIADVFVPSIVGIAVLSALGWLVLGPAPQIAFMIKSAMSVLLCACPCAMGLAVIPIEIGVYEMLKKSILVRDATAVEPLANINTVVWDKTDTLTTPAVEEDVYIGQKGYSRAKVIQIIASVEKAAYVGVDLHPIARSFIDNNLSNAFLSCEEAQIIPTGVTGILIEGDNRHMVVVSNLNHLKRSGVKVEQKFIDMEEEYLKRGMTCAYLAINNKCISLVGLKHTLRPCVKNAVEELRTMGIDSYILTGDNNASALQVANELKIESIHVMSEQNKFEKRDRIIELQKAGRRIAYIGDGINDLLALETADVGIALGAWTSAAGNCKIALQNPNVATAIIIARETMNNIRQNLFWTGVYNLFSLAAATGLLYPFFGFVLNPVIASLSMAFSSVFVIMNSSRLAFEVEHKLELHSDPKNKSLSWYDKLINMFTLKPFFRTLEMFLTMTQGRQKPTLAKPNLKPTYRPLSQSSSPRKPATAAVRSSQGLNPHPQNRSRRNLSAVLFDLESSPDTGDDSRISAGKVKPN